MDDKQRVAQQAVREVKSGMVVGLGTGSTANYFIQELARYSQQEGLSVKVVASSVISTVKALELGLELLAIEQLAKLDLYVDGADEVTADLVLLKGRGSDLVREKILAKACDKFLVLVDQTKLVERLGSRFPIPVEVLPFAWQLVQAELEKFGGKGTLRLNANRDGMAVTAQGSLVLDMEFPVELDCNSLDASLSNTPGVVEHGIFRDLASVVYIGSDGQVEKRIKAH